jgi:UDP-glucose 4-epimerase
LKILVTGGAGYIGSTIASAALDNGIEPIILDSLVTGQRAFTAGRIFYEGDIADRDLIGKILREHPDVFCTIHCAALIVIPESVKDPYRYYRENVSKSAELFKTLVEAGYPRIVFSSSASIYDSSANFQVDESSPLTANCPYARTKIMMEQILADFCRAYALKGLSLRYFNPIGADPKLRSGPHARNPSHLLGALVEVHAGRRKVFELNGVKWPTRDGTAVRDYVHVWDLARAHILAVQKFDSLFQNREQGSAPYSVINLGAENGVTVREFIAAFERVVGAKVPMVEAEPRPGDSVGAFANADRAHRLLGWHQEKSIEDGIRDALRWNEKRMRILGY